MGPGHQKDCFQLATLGSNDHGQLFYSSRPTFVVMCGPGWARLSRAQACQIPSLGPQPYEAQARPQPRLRPRLWLENFLLDRIVGYRTR